MQSSFSSDDYLYKAYQLAQVLSEAMPLGELRRISVHPSPTYQRGSLAWDLKQSPSLQPHSIQNTLQ